MSSNAKTNPHSVQALLDQTLDPDLHVNSLNHISDAAATIAAQFEARAIRKRTKIRQKESLLATQKKAARSKKALVQNAPSDSSNSKSSSTESSSASSSSSSDDSDYDKKVKAGMVE